MKNVLLIRFGGLGDLLVAVPSIRLVRGRFPDARLTLACRREYGALLVETGVVDEIIPEDSRLLTPLFSGAPEAETNLHLRLESFDLVMGWTHGQKGTGFIHTEPSESGQLSRIFFRKTAEAIGESGSLPIDEWARLPADRLRKSEILKGIAAHEGMKRAAVVHPGSGSEGKRWPLENFLRIIGRLGKRGIGGSLVTGEAEEKMAAELENAALPKNWTWIHRPNLIALASLLEEAGLYLGNDSGVTHLAAACGAEVIALFMREYASAWEPLGRVHLHIADSLSEISLECVWKTVASRLTNFSADSQNC